MNRIAAKAATLITLMLLPASSLLAQDQAQEVTCFESRKGASEITQQEVEPGLDNVKCSDTTGGVLWWGDPYRRHPGHG